MWLCSGQAASRGLSALPLCFPVWRMGWGQSCLSQERAGAPQGWAVQPELGLGTAAWTGRLLPVMGFGTACAINQRWVPQRLLCWGHWEGESGHDPHFQPLTEPKGSHCSDFGVLCAGLWQLQSNPSAAGDLQISLGTSRPESISIPCFSLTREFSSPKPPPALTLTPNYLKMTQMLAQMPRNPSTMESCSELQNAEFGGV